MSTKTIIAWINGDAQSIEVNVPEYIELEPTIEDRLLALEQYQSPEFVSSITLFATNWVGSTSPYSQEVEISGITPYSKVDLQPSAEQLNIFYEKDLAFVAENENGKITVYCGGHKPTNDYTIQVTVTEVIINE